MIFTLLSKYHFVELNILFFFELILSFLWVNPFFSLAQRKETKENIGCKLFAKN